MSLNSLDLSSWTQLCDGPHLPASKSSGEGRGGVGLFLEPPPAELPAGVPRARAASRGFPKAKEAQAKGMGLP